MILVDTSVWISYFRGKSNAQLLEKLLHENEIVSHPWILCELRLGYLGRLRLKILEDMALLKQLPDHPIQELSDFIEHERLFGKGISLVDAGLLYAAISEDCALWTTDKNLHKAARKYMRAYLPSE